MSLNGEWQFHYAVNAKERPVDFYQPEYNREYRQLFANHKVRVMIEELYEGVEKRKFNNSSYPLKPYHM